MKYQFTIYDSLKDTQVVGHGGTHTHQQQEAEVDGSL